MEQNKEIKITDAPALPVSKNLDVACEPQGADNGRII